MWTGRTIAIGKVTKLIENTTIDEATAGVAGMSVNA
jgi:peptide chain release factor subunit 3